MQDFQRDLDNYTARGISRLFTYAGQDLGHEGANSASRLGSAMRDTAEKAKEQTEHAAHNLFPHFGGQKGTADPHSTRPASGGSVSHLWKAKCHCCPFMLPELAQKRCPNSSLGHKMFFDISHVRSSLKRILGCNGKARGGEELKWFLLELEKTPAGRNQVEVTPPPRFLQDSSKRLCSMSAGYAQPVLIVKLQLKLQRISVRKQGVLGLIM